MAGEITPLDTGKQLISRLEVKEAGGRQQAENVGELTPTGNPLMDMKSSYQERTKIEKSGEGSGIQKVAEPLSLKNLLPENPFFIPASKVEEIKEKLGMTSEQLLRALVSVAKEKARPPISNYLVGAAGIGKSGNVYLGVNLEFPGFPLNQTVHGEQFVMANALNNCETGLTDLAISAPPCGHCRQFLNELVTSKELKLLINQEPSTPFANYLPKSFGPQDLGIESALLAPRDNKLSVIDSRSLEQKSDDTKSGYTMVKGGSVGIVKEDSVIDAALKAANRSYAPYSNNPSGIAIQTKDGKIYSGSYMENAAFNPSLSPLQGALVALVSDGKSYNEISRVLLLEKEKPQVSQEGITRDLVKSLSSSASFEVLHVR